MSDAFLSLLDQLYPYYVVDYGDLFLVVRSDDILNPKAVCLTREAAVAAARLLNS